MSTAPAWTKRKRAQGLFRTDPLSPVPPTHPPTHPPARRNRAPLTGSQPHPCAGAAFYRAESAPGRDLAVLAAALYRQEHGRLNVLELMAGSGMRGARYLRQVRWAAARRLWGRPGLWGLWLRLQPESTAAAGDGRFGARDGTAQHSTCVAQAGRPAAYRHCGNVAATSHLVQGVV